MLEKIRLLMFIFAAVIAALACTPLSAGERTDELDKVVLKSGEVLFGIVDTLGEHSIIFFRDGSTVSEPINLAGVKSLKIGPVNWKSQTEIRDFDRVIRKSPLDPYEGNIVSEKETDTQIFIFPRKYESKIPVPLEKSNIVRIEGKNSAKDVFTFRLRYVRVTKSETADSLYDVADWAAPFGELDDLSTNLLLRIMRTWPEFQDAYVLLSDKYAEFRERGEPRIEAELGLYIEAVKRNAATPNIFLRMGELLDGEGLLMQALDAFDNATALAKVEDLVTLSFKGMLGKARILMKREKYDQARRILDEILSVEEDNFQALVALGDCLAATGEWEEAESRYKRVIELEPGVQPPHVKLGRLYLITGKLEEAAEVMKGAHNAGSETVESLTILGLVLARSGVFTEAEDALAKAVDMGATAETWLASGYLSENRKDFEDAVEAYKKAVAMREPTGAAHYHLASALVSLERHDEAEKQLVAALKVGFDATLTFDLMSVIARAQKKLEDAARFLRYALAGKETANRHYELGLVLFQSKKPSEARIEFQKAVALEENHAEALYGLGIISRSGGKLSEASEYFQRALAASPDDARIAAALKRTQDTSVQEVWVDSFDRADSEDAHNGWDDVENFGVTITLKDKACVFKGTQRTDKSDRTTLIRREPMRNREGYRFTRFEVEMNGAGALDARFGIRVEEGACAIVLAKNYDGKPVFFYRDEAKKWHGPTEIMGIPFDAAEGHTFAIEISNRKKGEFSLYVDNNMVKIITLSGLAKERYMSLGIYGQAETDTDWELVVNRTKIFWEKPARH